MRPVKVMQFSNFRPPLLFAGIHVLSFDPDMQNVDRGDRRQGNLHPPKAARPSEFQPRSRIDRSL
jgi:hypothetical protein